MAERGDSCYQRGTMFPFSALYPSRGHKNKEISVFSVKPWVYESMVRSVYTVFLYRL